MKITCDENGIVKWEEKEGHKEWHKIDGQWVHIKVVRDKAIDQNGNEMYVNGVKINLLPEKESTMKTRFAVVNLKEKVEFEKKWEMPYGYNNCPFIGFNQKEAINWINQNLGQQERQDYVVERHKAGMIEVVWKILPGHKIAGEDDWDELEDF